MKTDGISRKKLQTYNAALSTEELDEMKRSRYAPASDKQANWGCKAYNDWRQSAMETSLENCAEFIVKSDLTKPQSLYEHMFCESLCHFITEVRKHNEEEYLPQTVISLILSIQRYLKTQKMQW